MLFFSRGRGWQAKAGRNRQPEMFGLVPCQRRRVWTVLHLALFAVGLLMLRGLS